MMFIIIIIMSDFNVKDCCIRKGHLRVTF